MQFYNICILYFVKKVQFKFRLDLSYLDVYHGYKEGTECSQNEAIRRSHQCTVDSQNT